MGEASHLVVIEDADHDADAAAAAMTISPEDAAMDGGGERSSPVKNEALNSLQDEAQDEAEATVSLAEDAAMDGGDKTGGDRSPHASVQNEALVSLQDDGSANNFNSRNVDPELSGPSTPSSPPSGDQEGAMGTDFQSNGVGVDTAAAAVAAAAENYMGDYDNYASLSPTSENHHPATDADDNVSDISSDNGGNGKDGCNWNDNGMNSSSQHLNNYNMARNRSFTIQSVITSTSDHGSMRSQRENVDRLLMGGAGGEGGSMSGSDISPNPHTRGLERPTFGGTAQAHTYDQSYYKRGDWLRIVPRRTSTQSGGSNTPGTPDRYNRSSQSSQTTDSDGLPHSMDFNGMQYAHAARGANRMNPDLYYRGFDNTRIRGFIGASGATRMRTPLGISQSMHQNQPHMTHPTAAPAPGDFCYGHSHDGQGHLYPNIISVPIDEEEGGGDHPDEQQQQQQCSIPDGMERSTSPPLEIHCTVKEERARHHETEVRVHADELNQENILESDHIMIAPMKAPSPAPSPSPPPQTELEGGGIPFTSSLRTKESIPQNIQSSSNSQPQQLHSLPSHIQEQNMHEASWDSKYETYACRVDQSQEDRSTEITLFSMARPHMRGFHFAWLTFFFAFIAWFSITPLLAEVQTSLVMLGSTLLH